MKPLTFVELQALAPAMVASGSYFYCRRLLQMLERGELSVTEVLVRLDASKGRHPPHAATMRR